MNQPLRICARTSLIQSSTRKHDLFRFGWRAVHLKIRIGRQLFTRTFVFNLNKFCKMVYCREGGPCIIVYKIGLILVKDKCDQKSKFPQNILVDIFHIEFHQSMGNYIRYIRRKPSLSTDTKVSENLGCLPTSDSVIYRTFTESVKR
jgi:hypothetical protein